MTYKEKASARAAVRKELGLHIRRLREYAGLSQKELVERMRKKGYLGSAQSRISNWELGINAPESTALMILREALKEAIQERGDKPPDLF